MVKSRSSESAIQSRKPLKILAVVLFLFYPVLIYCLLKYVSLRIASFILVAVVFANFGSRILANPKTFKSILVQLIGIVTIIVTGAILNNEFFILHLPVFINLFLLAHFTYTIFSPPCMIERYASMFQSDLPDAEQVYCRHVTFFWIAFFCFNILVTETIICFGDLALWTLYVGFISYLLIGLIFSIEYIIRKVKFRRFRAHALDGLIKKFVTEKVVR